jgi:hypothetical protein
MLRRMLLRRHKTQPLAVSHLRTQHMPYNPTLHRTLQQLMLLLLSATGSSPDLPSSAPTLNIRNPSCCCPALTETPGMPLSHSRCL